MAGAFSVTGPAVLVGDQRSDQLLLLRDTDGDGMASHPDEITVFFDANNASGLNAPTESISGVFQAWDASVFLADVATHAVYHLTDLNKDDDAQDAFEASVWLSADNAAGLKVIAPNAVHQDSSGAIYISFAGQSSVYRTQDLNQDGDAMDAGEAEVWFDFSTIGVEGIPFSLSFWGDTGYLTDLGDPSGGALYQLRDDNGDGVIGPDEAIAFIDPEAEGIALDNVVATMIDQGSVLSMSWYPAQGNQIVLHRLTDLDGSGRIDAPDEMHEIWTSDLAPFGVKPEVGFSLAANHTGEVLLTGNSFSGEASVLRLSDNDFNGDYTAPTETILFGSSEFSHQLQWARAVEFYRLEEPVLASSDQGVLAETCDPTLLVAMLFAQAFSTRCG